MGRNPPPDDLHRGASARAEKRRPGFFAGQRTGRDSEDDLQQGNQAFSVGVQEAVVPCPAEALGQHVLQDQAQEVSTRQRADLHFTALAVAVAKADLAIRAGKDVAFPNDPAIEVAAEINERLLAVADTFAIDYQTTNPKITKAAFAAFFRILFSDQAENEEPQPQVEVALGLRITNCDPSKPSL